MLRNIVPNTLQWQREWKWFAGSNWTSKYAVPKAMSHRMGYDMMTWQNLTHCPNAPSKMSRKPLPLAYHYRNYQEVTVQGNFKSSPWAAVQSLFTRFLFHSVPRMQKFNLRSPFASTIILLWPVHKLRLATCIIFIPSVVKTMNQTWRGLFQTICCCYCCF